MASKRDYYEILGLSKGATADEIKSAYRKLAKQYHPDINKDPDAPKKFEEIQEAYDVLKDDQKRQQYDQFGHAAFEQGAGGNPYGAGGFGGAGFNAEDLGDIFSSFFGGGRRSGRASSGPRKGEDTLYRIKIDFMDSINGRKITIPLSYDEQCPHCHGSGAESPSDVSTCPNCRGTGTVRTRQQTIFGTMESQGTCPSCHGTGKKVTKTCHECGGSGYKRIKKDIEVSIPAGISNGQQIRIAGKGDRGINGGENGDLYVEVQVKAHSSFKREGDDIHIEVPLSFVDAALGAEIEVDTVYGKVAVDIPAGTQPDAVLKLRGKGVKNLRNGNPGDQYLHMKLKTPEKLSRSQKQLLEQLREEMGGKKKK
ncbi:MAG: molecular chaperone DnaJ [Bacilli bacterium]|nr:molecular chaperone DnaJ [Bacilli bacterium]